MCQAFAMPSTCQRFSATPKVQFASLTGYGLAALKGTHSRYRVFPSRIGQWKGKLLESLLRAEVRARPSDHDYRLRIRSGPPFQKRQLRYNSNEPGRTKQRRRLHGAFAFPVNANPLDCTVPIKGSSSIAVTSYSKPALGT